MAEWKGIISKVLTATLAKGTNFVKTLLIDGEVFSFGTNLVKPTAMATAEEVAAA